MLATTPLSPTALPYGCASRQARRRRNERRAELAAQRAPELELDRLAPLLRLLRAYREHDFPPGARSPIVPHLERLRAEVEAIEAWAARRGSAAQEHGDTIRQALTFLRGFGRLTSLDFSVVPTEERSELVLLLSLEHRWCYAAAGTTREAFKEAIGRTGAR